MFMSIMSSKSTLSIQTIVALGLFFEPIPVGFVVDLIDDMKSYLFTYTTISIDFSTPRSLPQLWFVAYR